MADISPWDRARFEPTETSETGQTSFVGRRRSVFWMSLKLGVLTILTLGMYRFWMKTRLRRWYWSAIRPQGHPLEYVGDPWEKLLGFLIAVVILAFYIGVVNLLLMFASFSLFNGNVAAYLLSFLGVIPLWFYAQYRSRRYVLARTRWRGIRFGLMPGAWGYTYRALWHWFLTLLTLGFLWPRKAFYLEKYKADRTYFGSEKMEQTGTWRPLLRPFLAVWIPIVLACGLAALAIGLEAFVSPVLFIVGVIGLFVWLSVALVNYNVAATRHLTSQKRVAGVALHIAPRARRVFGIYFWGYGLTGFAAAIIGLPLLIAVGILVSQMAGEADFGPAFALDLPQWVLPVLGAVTYFLLFLMWSVLVHAFVRMPLFRHYATSFELRHAQHIDQISQRPRDEFAEAEGIAEALDVGAAI